MGAVSSAFRNLQCCGDKKKASLDLGNVNPQFTEIVKGKFFWGIAKPEGSVITDGKGEELNTPSGSSDVGPFKEMGPLRLPLLPKQF